MKTSLKTLIRTTLLVAAIAALPAFAADPATTGALATPANRIVGLWTNDAFVGPCGGTPSTNAQKQTHLYHAGGTFLDNPRSSSSGFTTASGVMQRSIGIGTWEYSPLTGQWSLEVRFDWFKNGAYDGYQVIVRTNIRFTSADQITGDVEVLRYNAADVLVLQQCGYAVSTRQ